MLGHRLRRWPNIKPTSNIQLKSGSLELQLDILDLDILFNRLILTLCTIVNLAVFDIERNTDLDERTPRRPVHSTAD